MAENAALGAKVKHPPGLYLISFTSIWERFSYYGMRAFLILYMVNTLTSDKGFLGGLGMEKGTAGMIYGFFTGACYLLPLLGGFIADQFIGKRRSVLIGGVLIAAGHFTLAINAGLVQGLNTLPFFALGLVLLAIGNGFFKPTASSMIGDLYEQGDTRRDSAYTIYYLLFNGGAFLAPIVCGFFGETYGYQYGFLIAAIGMVLGLIVYVIGQNKYLGNIGLAPTQKDSETNKKENAPLTKQEKDRLTVIFVLLFFVTFFWAGFEQAGSTFTLYTANYIDRVFLGWEIPTTFFQAVNPIFIVLLGPVFSWLWIALAKKGKNPSTPIKMGLGMIALGLGFVFMMGAVLQRGGDIQDPTVKASLIWLLLTYFMHTIGELLVSPIGLSMVTKLAPVRLASLLMGAWFLSSFAANLLAGLSVEFVEKLGAFTIFGGIAVFVAALGVIVLFLSKWLLKNMHGAD